MAMSGTQKIGIGAVVLALLGVAVWKQQQKDEKIGTATKDSVDLPEIKGSDDLDKIVITHGDKGEVTLEKKGDKWMVTKPVEAPANQQNVKSLLDNMKELKVTELVDTNLTDENKKTYQFDTEHALHVVAYKGADKKVDDTFGKSGARGQMVMTAGRPGVYAATGYSTYLYGREVKSWRDTEIFKFEDTSAAQITIEKAQGTAAGADGGTKKTEAGTFSFTKNGDKWAGTWNGKAIERFDEEKVKDLLRTFHALNADDFGDGKSPADTGLDAPESTVTISLKDNAGKYVLKLGKVSSGTSHYAQKDGDATIFVVSNGASDWALAETSKFQKALDGGAPKQAASPMGMPPGMMGMPGMPPGHPSMP